MISSRDSRPLKWIGSSRSDTRADGAPGPGTRVLLPLGALVLLTACSPIYVIKAGIAEARILAGRKPIPEVVNDPATDEGVRGKLLLAMEARTFAAGDLGLDVGDSYTSFTRLEKDTLALVLSAAYRDRLQSRTWWFPIVGSVPYRGFFSEEDALNAQRDLEDEGFDTYLRPTSAFSTLGWFADPLLSTLLRYDHVELATTVLHELSHNHLFVSGHVRFNESFATFVGRVGAMEFFCEREGGGPDTRWCLRARARWRDARRFSAFTDDLVADLQAVYTDSTRSTAEKLAGREEVFEAFQRRFRERLSPTLESLTFGGFASTPLNNATLLSRMLYYHRLDDFHALYEAHDRELRAAVAALVEGASTVDDPFELLPVAPDGEG